MQACATAVMSFFLATTTASSAFAERWLKIDPNDPFKGDEGVFHQFDVDSAFEDRTTGFVSARMVFKKPGDVEKSGVKSWIVWAFDCKARNVYYVATPSESGTNLTADWRDKPSSLAKPLMGGVTNMFADKLCALKGSWPLGEFPAK